MEFPAAKAGTRKAGAAGAGAGGPGGRGGQVGGGLAGAWQRSSPPQRKLVAGAGVLMVAAAIAIAVVSFIPGGKTGAGSSNSASSGTAAAGGGAPAGQPSPAPAPSGSHKARHHKPARHHPAKKPTASPSPSPTPKKPRRNPHPGPHGIARLTAGVSVSGPTRSSQYARVIYAASNIGSTATKRLNGSITLPAGAVLAHDWQKNGSYGGWDCHSGGHLVICRHGSVLKDNQAVGSFSIVVRSRTACGQPVTFTVDGGTARTQAQSSALIQCSNVRFGALGLAAQSTPRSAPQLTARLALPLAI